MTVVYFRALARQSHILESAWTQPVICVRYTRIGTKPFTNKGCRCIQ